VSQDSLALQVLQTRGEVILDFTVADIATINTDLTNVLSIDRVRAVPGGAGFEVRAYANQQEFQNFLSYNIPFTVYQKPAPKAITMATTVAQMASWNRYPTYSVYTQMLANYASTYPSLCDLDTILSSTPSGNYKILVLKISDNVTTAENEPQFFYLSSFHGDETTGFILLLRLIDYLLTNYGTLTKVTNLVNNAEIWICPLSNPEGTYRNSSPAGSTIINATRGNLSGIDLNRNFPDPRAGQHPDGNSWQAETQAFMTFATTHHVNMGANFHGGAEVTNYPWDTWTTAGNSNADRLWWERVCTAYVDTARLTTASYMSDVVSDGVTEGGDWYVITGGHQDYMDYFYHDREQTIELDGTKMTQVEDLGLKWNENYRSLLNYLQESLYGVRGIITDSCSGLPIRAKVWVNSYDQTNDSSHVYSALPVGNYHKYMIAGTYSITYSASGYISKTINNIVLSNGAATVVDVQLRPSGSSTPAVSITASPGTTICAGTSVTFTATPTNGGSSPSYQWKLNGVSTGTNSPTYTTTTLTNGNVVSCVMTSSLSCASPLTATSNSLTMTVNPTVTPAVSISASATTICAGTNVTFTASPTNGGTPTYQWKLNGGNVGTNSATWASTALANGDQVSCVMTSTASCASPGIVTSNSITMTVNPGVVPSVTISASATTICSGTSVTFTATPVNGGTPSFQWKLNGGNVGGNSSTYTSTTLANGNVITCVMTSTATCATPATATSNAITMTVSSVVVPSVSIAAGATTICSGTSVTFTPTPVNGGTPSYQWLLNGSNAGSGATYTSNALVNGDAISCIMTSSVSCASPTTATSNTVTMTVNSSVTPSVSINASASTICSGTNVTFTASPVNGGTPVYQWKLNGGNVGTNSNTWSSTSLNNGDVITCQMTSTASCASPSVTSSNAITMNVTSGVTPVVTIAATATNICQGTSVSFTASPVNGGSPTYQWKLNGSNVGTNNATFTSASLVNGDVISCVMTSDLSCAVPSTATSNAITMTVNNNVTPAVSIAASETSICLGTSVTFTANPVDGGSSPLYQWLLNSVVVQVGSTTYTNASLSDNDHVFLLMTTSLACASPVTAVSNSIVMNVDTAAVPTATILATDPEICTGTAVTFTVTNTHGGTPDYLWLLNSVVVQNGSDTYTNSNLADGDVVFVVMTSDAACVSPITVVSNAITMNVGPDPDVVTVTDSNGILVSSVSYGNQWYEQTLGLIPGADESTFVPSVNGDYYILFTDSLGCTVVSNVVNVTTVGIAADGGRLDITLYPNPSRGEVYLCFSALADESLRISLVDVVGKEMLNVTDPFAAAVEISKDRYRLRIDLSGFSKGLYFIKVETTEQESVQRILLY
jgi:hypothetical protein